MQVHPQPSLITFDCYGTLIDWYGGLGATLIRLAGPDADLRQLCDRYVDLEKELEAGPYLPYREVMARTLASLADESAFPLEENDRDALGQALPHWQPYPEVPAVLARLQARIPLGILSNIDDGFLDASVAHLGMELAHRVTAEQVRSYKPAEPHFQRILEASGLAPGEILHVAGSLTHDIVPARGLGFRHLWVNRLEERRPEWLQPEQEIFGLGQLEARLQASGSV